MAILKPDLKDTNSNERNSVADWRDQRKLGSWNAFFEDFLKPYQEFSTKGSDPKKDFVPAVNIHESDKAYHIETELPGVKKEDVFVEVKNDYLVIRGEKNSFNEEKKTNYHHVERSHGSFYRTIFMPKDADKERISAEMKDGILNVELGKKMATQTENRKVEIR